MPPAKTDGVSKAQRYFPTIRQVSVRGLRRALPWNSGASGDVTSVNNGDFHGTDLDRSSPRAAVRWRRVLRSSPLGQTRPLNIAIPSAAGSGSTRIGGVLFWCFGSSIVHISNACAPAMGTPPTISNAPVAP
jgi:hypothetical protein